MVAMCTPKPPELVSADHDPLPRTQQASCGKTRRLDSARRWISACRSLLQSNHQLVFLMILIVPALVVITSTIITIIDICIAIVLELSRPTAHVYTVEVQGIRSRKQDF